MHKFQQKLFEMNLNKVMLIGRLGKDPDIRMFDNNVTLASFSMATTEYYKDREGNRQEKTEWHNITCWRRLGDVAKNYLRKGSLIYLEGKLQTRSYGEENNKKYITEVVATDLRMLEARGESAPAPLSVNNATSSNNSTANTNSGSYQVKGAGKPMNGVASSTVNDPDDLPF